MCVLLLPIHAGRAQEPAANDVSATVSRVGRYVQRYLGVARTIVARETVTLQPLDRDLTAAGRARRFVYDTRVEWAPGSGGTAGQAALTRRLVTVDGQVPRPGDEVGCLDDTSPEPLAFLLPERRHAFTFTPVALPRRPQDVIVFDYAPIQPGRPSLRWRGDCATFDLPGLVRGRVSVDATTFVVRQVEQQLVRPVVMTVDRELRRSLWGDSIDVQRADVSLRYAEFSFRDPDEKLWLPAEVERLTVVYTPAPHRLRATQRFSDYRRFVTGVRIRPAP